MSRFVEIRNLSYKHPDGNATDKVRFLLTDVKYRLVTCREIRRRTGVVFQDADEQLFMPMVQEGVMFGPFNLGWSLAEAEKRAREVLSQ
jgi:energy-coupling factor transporter ATP-binding protein EcfA2